MTDLAHRARAAHRRLRERAGLRERVRVLEAEVQENRQLNRRIAELTDVVTELLIPLESRDHERVDEVLASFRSGL
jgi:hypothetical protein